MLVSLLFVSRATEAGLHDLENILHQSRAYNAEHGITGALCYSKNIFMQVLEGSRTDVNHLYGRILQDQVHHEDVQLLHYSEITERSYSGWTMGRVDISRLNMSIVLKYSERPEFNPYLTSGEMSMAMFRELIATANIAGRG
ncbi:MAG: BLUF domain-containing protein [Brachymonas sp.]|uniref:BLUF domain-containing protein n=1 Tax=unclassified Brachymonas TaxID=2621329 RepID=UPI0035B09537